LGKIIKSHCTCIDIDDSKLTATRFRHAEDQLQQARAELAHVARLTTAGELTAMISHEVNQPLAALVNNASACLRWLAADTPDLEEIRQAVEAMRRSGHRASEIIGRIRTMVKKSPPRKDWLSINDTVTEVIDCFATK
jgi:C4-dicarboxylate-specific signal transduction histidine kinase